MRVRRCGEAEVARQALGHLRPRAPAVVAAVHAAVVLLVQAVTVGGRHHELVHAVADLGVLDRPVGAQAPVARRPGRAVVRGLEDAEPLHDDPEAGRIVGMRQDARQAEMAGRLVGRIVPGRAARLAVERAQQRPGLAAVTALEQAGRLGAGQHAPVRGAQTGDLRQPQVAVAIGQALARQLPGLAQVAAAPDARTVPLARGRRVDRARCRIVHRMVDRPPVAERTTHAPVAMLSIAFQQKAALARPDQQDDARHPSPPASDFAAESRCRRGMWQGPQGSATRPGACGSKIPAW